MLIESSRERSVKVREKPQILEFRMAIKPKIAERNIVKAIAFGTNTESIITAYGNKNPGHHNNSQHGGGGRRARCVHLIRNE